MNLEALGTPDAEYISDLRMTHTVEGGVVVSQVEEPAAAAADVTAGATVRIGEGHVLYTVLNVTAGVATLRSAGLTRRARPITKRVNVSGLTLA